MDKPICLCMASSGSKEKNHKYPLVDHHFFPKKKQHQTNIKERYLSPFFSYIMLYHYPMFIQPLDLRCARSTHHPSPSPIPGGRRPGDRVPPAGRSGLQGRSPMAVLGKLRDVEHLIGFSVGIPRGIEWKTSIWVIGLIGLIFSTISFNGDSSFSALADSIGLRLKIRIEFSKQSSGNTASLAGHGWPASWTGFWDQRIWRASTILNEEILW